MTYIKPDGEITVLRDVVELLELSTPSRERQHAIEHINRAILWLTADTSVVAAQGHDDYREATP